MDVREKLVEILKQAPFEGKVLDEWWWEEKIARIADHLIAHGVTVQGNTEISDELLERLRKAPVTVMTEEPTIEVVQEWISAKDRLPDDGEAVLIWSGGCHVATIEKGITEEERRQMRSGELPDPEETGWTLSSGYFTTKRSRTYTRADVFGNNKVPYCWNGVNSPMNWFGQDVTHWMPLPQPPKGE